MKKITQYFVVLFVFMLVLMGCLSSPKVSVGDDGYITFFVASDGRNKPYPSNSSGYYAIITGFTGTATDIEIPREVKFGINVMPVSLIEARAFEGKGLKNVIIPNTVYGIGSNAFANNQLTTIIIPDSVNEIHSNAFRNNQLNNVTFPANIRTIGANAFAGNPSLSNIPMTAQQRQQQQQNQQQTERQAQLTQQRAAEQAEYNRIVGLYRNAGQSFGNLPGTTWRGLVENSVATLQFHAGGIYQLNIGGELLGHSIAGTYRVSGNTVIFNQEPPRSSWIDMDNPLIGMNDYESGVLSGNSLRILNEHFNVIFHRQ